MCKACYFHIRALRHIRASLPDDVACMIACSIVGSRLDYCNSILAGTSETNFVKLQRVQNTLARVVTGTRRYDHVKCDVIHITPVVAKLHWLPVKARVTFKLATLVYKIRQFGSPSYLASLLSVARPVRGLRSTSSLALEVTGCRLKTSERAFRHSAVAVWNSLPSTVVECETVGAFRKQLKTYLYDVAYKTV